MRTRGLGRDSVDCTLVHVCVNVRQFCVCNVCSVCVCIFCNNTFCTSAVLHNVMEFRVDVAAVGLTIPFMTRQPSDMCTLSDYYQKANRKFLNVFMCYFMFLYLSICLHVSY